jgi:hypothetical protein
MSVLGIRKKKADALRDGNVVLERHDLLSSLFWNCSLLFNSSIAVAVVSLYSSCL